jgi:osmotically-inducible protein OsmY
MMKTDLQVKQDVIDELNWKPSVKATDIGVEVANGIVTLADAEKILVNVSGGDVTLSGTVHSWAERELATHSAWGTHGVRSVVDNIVVAY